jgi:hypothetical protein
MGLLLGSLLGLRRIAVPSLAVRKLLSSPGAKGFLRAEGYFWQRMDRPSHRNFDANAAGGWGREKPGPEQAASSWRRCDL